MTSLLFIMLAAAVSMSSGEEPELLWHYEALSNLYAPPLAADITAAPGMEIVIGDSEARKLRCISAQGEHLWEYSGDWAKRLISPAALSNADSDGRRRIAIANGDGSLSCISAETGTLLWRQEPGAVEWGGALWVNASSGPAVVVATEQSGIYAYSQEGVLLWRIPETATHPSLQVRGPLAAADSTGDGVEEIFGASRFGVFCVTSDGALLWEQNTGDDFPGGVIVADTDNDGNAEIYAVSRDDAFLWRFDARTGTPVWRAPMHARVDTYSAASLAAGDITGNGYDEIVLGDGSGHVYAFSHEGALLWTFRSGKPTHMAASLGDVTGDGRVNVLAASGDHYLYCLDGYGRLLWRYKTGLRLIYAPTLTDLDGDGKTDILLCGSDRMLRRLVTSARYSEHTMPWPFRGFDARQSASAFGNRPERPRRILQTEMLPLHGDFEQGKVRDGLEQFDPESPFYRTLMSRPRRWRMEAAGMEEYGLSDEAVHEGGYALRIGGPGRMVSEPWAIQPGLREVHASVYRRDGAGSAAMLQWLGDHGLIEETPLAEEAKESGWLRMAVSAAPPAGARYLVLALESGAFPLFWDTASVEAVFERATRFDVLVNQAGYDLGAPMRFVVQANFHAEAAAFTLVRDDGAVVLEDVLNAEGPIVGYYGNDWGYHYYTGDFSGTAQPGRYRIRVTLDGMTEYSWPFAIDKSRLWEATAEPAYRFFYYQRCGMAVPDFHEACHLDDAAGPDGEGQYDLWGGWHDAGDYNKYHNAPYVYGLAVAYTQRREGFDEIGKAPSGPSDFFDEILWGGDHVRRMVMADGSAFGHITSGYGFWGPPELETDNMPGTGDERRGTRASGDNPDAHQAALARIAVLLDGQDAMNVPHADWVETAARSLDYALRENRRGLWQLSTATDLFSVTRDPKYADIAASLCAEIYSGNSGVAEPSSMHIEVARRCDGAFGMTLAETLRPAVLQKAEHMLLLADNPFGVYTFGPAERPNYFGTPADRGGWHVGTSSHLLEAAAFIALAHQYDPDPRYLRFIYDQLNWTLGMNPFNISLMEGVGSAFLPTYHHRYVFSGVARGAVPGGVVNGVTWRSVGDDRPFLDLSGVDIPAYEPNEVWLPHNTAFLNALANMMTARDEEVR